MRGGSRSWGFPRGFIPPYPTLGPLPINPLPLPRPGGLLIAARNLSLSARPPNLGDPPRARPETPSRVRMMPRGEGLGPSSPRPHFSPGGAEAGQTQRIGVAPKKVLRAVPLPRGHADLLLHEAALAQLSVRERRDGVGGVLSEPQRFPAQGGPQSKDAPSPGSARKTF